MGADGVVIRHGASGAPHRLATSGWIDAARHQRRRRHPRAPHPGAAGRLHPARAPAPAARATWPGLQVTIVGDVLHSRVARSNVLLLNTLGARVTLVAPPTLLPVGVEDWPCEVSYDLDEPLPSTDALMMLRVQRERMSAAYFPSEREYSRRYGLDARARRAAARATRS